MPFLDDEQGETSLREVIFHAGSRVVLNMLKLSETLLEIRLDIRTLCSIRLALLKDTTRLTKTFALFGKL